MSPASAPPPDRPELFDQAVEQLEHAFARALPPVLESVATALERAGQAEPEQQQRQALYAIAAMLRIEVRARVGAAVAALRERVRKCLEYAVNAGDEERALLLIEEDELRAQILAAEIARTIRQDAGQYAAWAGRVRALRPGLWESDDLNPLGARTLVSAALGAFGGLGEAGAAAASLDRSIAAHLPGPLISAVEEADRWLKARGVAPLSEAQALAARSRPVAGTAPSAPASAPSEPASAAPAEAAAAPAAAGMQDAAGTPGATGTPGTTPPAGAGPASEAGQGDATRALEATAQAAAAAASLGTSPLAEVSVRARPGVLPTLQPVVEIERDALAFAHSIGAVPYSREARAGFFGNARGRLRGAGAAPGQTAVVDVVAAMFDYVVDDQRVPEAAKPLIWRLQQPALALSLLDPVYLGDEPRSLRRLVENLGAIVNAFADDLSRGSELYRRLETVVRAVEIVAGALQTRSAVMARQVEHEYTRAARNVTQLIERVVQERASLEAAPGRRNRRDYSSRPDRAREQEVTERLSVLLGERLDRHKVPESVREFVLNVWLRHLRTAILRDGEDSAEYKVALQVVDDLLWSLDSTRERQSRSQLAQKIPPLIRLLTQGLRAIGARDDEFKSFFDELFLIHLRKMQRRRRGADTLAGEGAEPRTGGAPQTGSAPPTGGGAADAEEARAPRTRAGVSEEDAGAITLTRVQPGTDEAAQERGPVPDAAPRPDAAPQPEAGPPETREAGPAEAQEAGPAGTQEARPAEDQEAGAGQRLLEVLASLDLDDLPARPQLQAAEPQQALADLRRGDWLQLVGQDGQPMYAKVAWINARRTVVLMVRHPDRRALSMRAAELLERLRDGRAGRVTAG